MSASSIEQATLAVRGFQPAAGLQTSICGQAPSVYPEYSELLVRCGIDAISVNLDVVDRTRRLIAAAETRLILDSARATMEAQR